jgi:hypothetical protein
MSKMIQLRHVPDALHRQLKARAALEGLSLSNFLIRGPTVQSIAHCADRKVARPNKSTRGVLNDHVATHNADKASEAVVGPSQ